MSNAVYPTIRGLGFTTMKSAEFSTIVQSSAARVETRIVQSQNPVWRWSLIYNYLKDAAGDLAPGLNYTDLKTLMGFVLGRQGRFDDFLYDDPYDDSVGPALLPGGAPNLQAQLQLVQNTNTGVYYSPIQRNMGGQFYEDITDLGVSGIGVYANGAVQAGGGTNYTLSTTPGLSIPGFSFYGQYLTWAAMPSVPITAQFNFYFRVRFEMDEQDFDQFMQYLWAVGGPEAGQGAGYVKMITAKTANL